MAIRLRFIWNGASENNWDIYVKTIGSETPLRLTTAAEPDMAPQWSPDGRTIAFERVLPGDRIAIMLIPPLGGPERKLAESFCMAGGGGLPGRRTENGWRSAATSRTEGPTGFTCCPWKPANPAR